MISLALYFLAAFGLAYIVGHSAISMPVRLLIGGPEDKPRAVFGYLVALLECPACFGTWIGLATGAFMPGLFHQTSWWAGAIVAACATAGLNFVVAKATGLMPSEPDPMREQLAALIMSQIQPPAPRWVAEPGVHTTNLEAAAEEEKKQTSILIHSIVPGSISDAETFDKPIDLRVSLSHLRDVLAPLQYFASGDAHENEVREDSLEALTEFDKRYPGVLVADDKEDGDELDIDGNRVEGIVPDAEIERAESRNAPEDTPENWAKYCEAHDFADKLAKEITAKRGAKDYWSLSDRPANSAAAREAHTKQHRADDFNLRTARENAGKMRPKDPMQTHSLNDAAIVDDLTPEDIAAFQVASSDAAGHSIYPHTPEQGEDAQRWAEKNAREAERRTELGTDSPEIVAALNTVDEEF